MTGNKYGTSFVAVESVKQKGQICVLDLEVKGVQSIKKTSMGAKFVFIQPPSMQVLEQRLRGRNTESEDSLAKRLQSAQESLDYAKQSDAYDLVIINDDMDQAYAQLEAFVKSHWKNL